MHKIYELMDAVINLITKFCQDEVLRLHSSEKGGFSLKQLPTLAVLLKMCVLTF